MFKGETMTTLFDKSTICSVCGTEQKFKRLASTSAFGSSDLDTRPPKKQRFTMFTLVQRCSECGYCASDLGISRSGIRGIMDTEEYRKQLCNSTYPDLTNSFLCKAILDQATRGFAAATWALIHAAWVCDDSGHSKQAVVCRTKAAAMLRIAEQHGQQVGKSKDISNAILTDLLRRSDQKEEARQLIKIQREEVAESLIARILDFQTALIDKNDIACHTIEELPKLR
jgi:uncharacterized protein (DUF2225 family)